MVRLRLCTFAGVVITLCFVTGCATERRSATPVLEPADGGGVPHELMPDGAAPRLDASDDGSDAATDPPIRDAEPADAQPADAELPDAESPDAEPSDAGPEEPRVLDAPSALAPAYLGILVGPGAQRPQPNLRLYGTDLGITFEHAGQLQMLFGDTWFHDEQVCGDAPLNDDTIALMPSVLGASVPQPSFVTRLDVTNEPRALRVVRDGESLSMGFGQVPMAAFSDGDRAFAFFARLAPQACDESDAPRCATEADLACSERIGECQPPYTTMTLSCDLETAAGCLPGQTCEAGAPVCIDPYTAQNDSSIFGETSAIAQRVELAVQGADPSDYRSVHTWPTSKFATLAARTVKSFSGTREGSDYAPGRGELLVWGRPGFIGEHGREAQLYLMRHRLPLAIDEGGALAFKPRYFAGLDETGEPRWAKDQASAQPLALDGAEGGSAHEELYFTGQPAVSWLPAPINKWVMLYGGDITDLLMVDALASRTARAPGAIAIRFAEHPWGPWTPPQPHFAPGTPGDSRSLYASGGLLYHPDCIDGEQTRCARSDPWRPPDSATACLISTQALDPGRLYGVNIIDNYTTPNEQGGLDFVWNVSLWNPYAVALMRTRVVPPPDPVAPDELADARGMQRMGDFAALPVLDPGRKYRQQTSRDRGTSDTSFPLSGFGNRDFNNFICKSPDAELAIDQFAPFLFDEPECEEDYVQGVVLARFEGPGRHVRTWLGMASLMFAPADNEVLRIYVDGDPTPRVEAPLAAVLDGSAGEMFAPPFGAGSPRRLAWYYPIAFQEKLIIALDRLGAFDEYFFHSDVVQDAHVIDDEPATRRDRHRAITQLEATFHPAGAHGELAPREELSITPGHTHDFALEGPATVHELELRVEEAQLAQLAHVDVRVRWDGAASDAISLPLLALFAAGSVPPEGSTHAITSYLEGEDRVLVLKLPMPFARSARFMLRNQGMQPVSFELAARGVRALPYRPFGKLHVIDSELSGPTDAASHDFIALEGRGRLVGVCAYLEGQPDAAGGLQYDPLNLLEGDVRIWTDGALAIDGTGTEEYADDVFYFSDAPHENAFVQAWGLVNDVNQSAIGEASLCRWHVLGTELDFESSLAASFELGGAANPETVVRHRTVAFMYLAE
jgi:hypothetical protein